MSASNQPIIIKKKKVAGHGGHHGGSWKVAYADFVTAMMAFFMVMWIMGLSEDVRKSIQGYFNDPIGFMKNEPRSKSVIAMSSASAGKPRSGNNGSKAYDLEQRALAHVERSIEKELAGMKGLGDLGKDVKVEMTPEGLEIQLVEERAAAFFESGSAVVRPLARQIIARLAPILARSGKPMVIQGHTDAAPFAAPGGNFALSASRANSLMQLLQGKGCPESQFKEVVGYGATKLVTPDKPFDFSNRRVTILIPRQEGGGEAKPADELRDRLQGGREPQALDLRPEAVHVIGG